MADLPSDVAFAQPDPAVLAANKLTEPPPDAAIPNARRTAQEVLAPTPASVPRGGGAASARYSDNYGGGKGPDAAVNQSLKIANAATEEGPNWMDKHRSMVIPILTGLGAMASSDSRYLGSAMLQGLGAGAQAYGKERDEEIAQAHGATNIGKTGAEIGREQQGTKESAARTAGEVAANWQRGTITQNWAGTPFSSHIWDTPQGPRVVKDVEADEFQKAYPGAAWRDPNTLGGVTPVPWESPTKRGAVTPVAKPDEGGGGAPVTGGGAHVVDTGERKVSDLMPGVVYPDKALDTDKSERALALENKSTAGAAMAKKNEVAALANTARETDSRLHSYASHVADANAQGVGGPQAGNIANAYALYMQLLKQAGYKDPIPAFTDANAAQQFMAKNQDFLAAQTSDAFGQHSNAARQALAMSLPNIDMQPEVRSAMMAQLLVDQQRVKELDSAYKYSSTKAGGPQRSFENVPTNYDNANKGRLNAAKQQLTSLMMHPSDFMKRAFNGEFTEAEIERRLAGNGDPRKAMPGYDPSMHISSFFPHKAPPRQ